MKINNSVIPFLLPAALLLLSSLQSCTSTETKKVTPKDTVAVVKIQAPTFILQKGL